MLRLYRPETIENEKRPATNQRGFTTPAQGLPARAPRLVWPEVSAA